MSNKWVGLLDQVDKIIVLAKAAPTSVGGVDGDYLQAQLSRYGCLLTCAAIEQALVESLSDYAGRAGDDRLRGFVSDVLSTGKNPMPEYICATVGRFDVAWNAAVSNVFQTTVAEDKIRSIVSNRNRIAHGQSVGMGIKSLVEWLPAARKLCEELSAYVSGQIVAKSGPTRKQRREKRRRRR